MVVCSHCVITLTLISAAFAHAQWWEENKRYALTNTRGMEKGRVDRGAGERRSRSPQARKEPVKPMSAVEEVIKEPQYVVDREKVRSSRCQVFIPIRTHQHMALCLQVGMIHLFFSRTCGHLNFLDMPNATPCVLQHGSSSQVIITRCIVTYVWFYLIVFNHSHEPCLEICTHMYMCLTCSNVCIFTASDIKLV